MHFGPFALQNLQNLCYEVILSLRRYGYLMDAFVGGSRKAPEKPQEVQKGSGDHKTSLLQIAFRSGTSTEACFELVGLTTLHLHRM